MAGNIQGICLCSALITGMCLGGFLLILGLTFPLAQIMLGVMFMHECPAAPVIPVYVMVSGIWALIMIASLALLKIFYPGSPGRIRWTVWIISLSVLFVALLLCGSYQVYSICPPNYDRNTTSSTVYSPPAPGSRFSLASENQNLNLSRTRSVSINQTAATLGPDLGLGSPAGPHREPFCSRTMYLFAFWTTTLLLVAAGLVLAITVCLWGFRDTIDKFLKRVTF